MQVLNLPERPTAMLVSGNLVTVGVLKAIIEKGLSTLALMTVLLPGVNLVCIKKIGCGY